MRVPVVYSAAEIVNWHMAEEYEPGRWRPSRNCEFHGLRHWKVRCRIAWRVFCGKLDAVNWGVTSGEVPATQRRYKDCTEPEFFTATKIHEYPS